MVIFNEYMQLFFGWIFFFKSPFSLSSPIDFYYFFLRTTFSLVLSPSFSTFFLPPFLLLASDQIHFVPCFLFFSYPLHYLSLYLNLLFSSSFLSHVLCYEHTPYLFFFFTIKFQCTLFLCTFYILLFSHCF